MNDLDFGNAKLLPSGDYAVLRAQGSFHSIEAGERKWVYAGYARAHEALHAWDGNGAPVGWISASAPARAG